MEQPIQTIDELLRDAITVEPLAGTDGKSGARVERAQIGDDWFVVKYVSLGDDWIMRLTKDHRLRPLQVWEAGVHDRLPDCIDDAVVAFGLDDPDHDRMTATLAVLMHDVSESLVPEGDVVVARAQHRQFIDHMAALHASLWGWRDQVGLLGPVQRYLWFASASLAPELARADCAPTVRVAEVGWRLLAERRPEAHEGIARLHANAGLLAEALAATPLTFVHGDWKMGNLGTAAGGRTVLLDWAVPGSGPACVDLVHYLALNSARLPEPKESAIDGYRASLEARGIDTDPWWDRQLALCLLGGMVMFGWEKALEDGDEAEAELEWWMRRVADGVRWLS